MDKEKFQAHLDKGQNYLVDLLKSKTTVKLDVYKNTIEWFKVFKDELNNCIELIKAELTDDRIRMRVVSKGDTEIQLFIGSDVLVFSMHTNIFL